MAAARKHHIITRHVAPLLPVALSLLSGVVPSPKPKGPPPPPPGMPVAAVCEDVLDFQDCHSRYETGCSPSAGYDAYLNLVKNRLIPPVPATSSVRYLTQQDFQNLDSNTPEGLGGGSKNHADFKDQLDQLGEGKVFGLIGYLYYAKKTGSESSNCELAPTDPEGSNVDYHVGIGFDPALAEKLRNNKSLTPEDKKQLTQTSVIVEMTPHYRFTYENGIWTADALAQVIGSQVRVTGQLLVDSEHNVAGQNCSLGVTPKCWRASVWELHPVTGFQVCKDSTNACAPTSQAWAELGHPGP